MAVKNIFRDNGGFMADPPTETSSLLQLYPMKRQDAGKYIPTSPGLTTAAETLCAEQSLVWNPADWIGKTVWDFIVDLGYEHHEVCDAYKGLESGTVPPPATATWDEIRRHNKET